MLSPCTKIVDYSRLLHLIPGLEAYPLALPSPGTGTATVGIILKHEFMFRDRDAGWKQ
jgi:hypothetical protein